MVIDTYKTGLVHLTYGLTYYPVLCFHVLFVVCFVDGAAEVRLLVDPIFAVPLVPDDRVRVDCCVRSEVYRAFVRRSSRFASVFFGAPRVSICYVSFC